MFIWNFWHVPWSPPPPPRSWCWNCSQCVFVVRGFYLVSPPAISLSFSTSFLSSAAMSSVASWMISVFFAFVYSICRLNWAKVNPTQPIFYHPYNLLDTIQFLPHPTNFLLQHTKGQNGNFTKLVGYRRKLNGIKQIIWVIKIRLGWVYFSPIQPTFMLIFLNFDITLH